MSVHLKFSVFAKEKDVASLCSCRTFAAEENHVMFRLNLISYTVPCYHPFTRNDC